MNVKEILVAGEENIARRSADAAEIHAQSRDWHGPNTNVTARKGLSTECLNALGEEARFKDRPLTQAEYLEVVSRFQ